MGDEYFALPEAAGEYTAERFAKQHPEKYLICVSLLAEGLGRKPISDMLRCSHHTVRAVQLREPNAIAIAKQRLGAMIGGGARLTVEAILDDLSDPKILKKIGTVQKGILLGILTDKYQLLTGGATSRVEDMRRRPEHEDFESYLAGLRDTPEGEVTPIDLQTETQEPKGTESGPVSGPTAPPGELPAGDQGESPTDQRSGPDQAESGPDQADSEGGL
jgi:hypothetical protein